MFSFHSITYERIHDKEYRAFKLDIQVTGQRSIYITVANAQAKLINDFHHRNGDIKHLKSNFDRAPIFRRLKADSSHTLSFESLHDKSALGDELSRVVKTQHQVAILSNWDDSQGITLRRVQIPSHLRRNFDDEVLFTLERDNVHLARCFTIEFTPDVL